MPDDPRAIAGSLDERARRTLIDLCDCPGLFAGQYDDLERLPSSLVLRTYDGAAGFMGIAKASASGLGLQVRQALEAEGRS